MVTRLNVRYAILLFAFAIASLHLSSETFRVRKLVPLKISGNDAAEQSITIGINDSIALFMPEDMTFLEGIEIKMQIPAEVSEWRDSVACSVYDGIKPFPSESQIDYSGTRIFVSALPSKLSWIIHIPLKQTNSLKDSGYISKINAVPNVKSGYTFVRFQPAMKGIPEETINAKLTLAVKPILLNKGRLSLLIKTPSNSGLPCEVFVDDDLIDNHTSPLILDTGMHKLSVQSQEYRTEMRSFLIEQAKTSQIEIELKSLAPTLTIIAPDNAQIFLDDEPYKKPSEPNLISEGEHKLRFVLGDYEVMRTLDIHKGKSYTVNLSVDLKITEE